MGRIYKRGAIWYADYIDRDGNRVRKPTKMRDRQLASKVLAKWETEENLVEVGMKPRTKGDEPLSVYLGQFRVSKSAAGKTDGHVTRTVQLIENIAQHAGWKKLGDVAADGVNAYSDHLKKDLGQSARTINSSITAVRSFCRWCVRNGYLASDPTATVEKPSAKADRRLERRMLLQEEWTWLKTFLQKSTTPEANGQSPAERLLMYRVAIETGLRSNELRSLTRDSLKLDGKEPHVIAKASTTKNSRLAKQYISDGLAADLTRFVSKKLPGAAVFHVDDRTAMASTLRNDIDGARKLWLKTPDGKKNKEGDFLKATNAAGEVLDFHALRHTCGAWLVAQGVTLAEVQQIMRHSTITLTVDCYGHIAPDARSRSRNVLGGLL